MTSRRRKIVWIASAGIAGAAGLVLFLFDPARSPIYPGCLFHQTTGLDCPGCGGLRAGHQLLHGNWAAAFEFNALFVLLLPVLVLLAIRAAWHWHRGLPRDAVRPLWLWLFFGVTLAFGVLRNVEFSFLAW